MNRYLLGIIIRTILIAMSSFACIWFYVNTNRPATTLLFMIILIGITANLVFFLNKVNRDLTNFLTYLHENNTTLAFSRQRVDQYFGNITTQLDHIILKIQDERLAREEKHQFLQTVFDHVSTGIVVYNEKGNCDVINPAAQKILGINHCRSLDELANQAPGFYEILCQPNVIKGPQKIKTGKGELLLSVNRTSLKFRHSQLWLVNFQDIRSEMEAQEVESWKKLIRMLRHEIMNSITPITTLTTAIKRSFENDHCPKPLNEISRENINDTLECATLIEERSNGLISFVEKFKSFTNLPKPNCVEFRIDTFLLNLRRLFSADLEKQNIEFQTSIDQGLNTLYADEVMIHQAVINLIKNAVEALPEKGGKIDIGANRDNTGRILFRITDNGAGIDPDNLQQIFVPSFTTKENGTGIGLSLTKLIMQLHNGHILVESAQEQGTSFTLIFPDCAFSEEKKFTAKK